MNANKTSRADVVGRLLGELTVEEKVAQLASIDASDLLNAGGEIDLDAVDALLPYGIGHVASTGVLGANAEQMRERIGALQERITELSHGIPALFHIEALNGVIHEIGTQFATPLGLACTWHPPLVEKMARVARGQMIDVGIRHALSPVLDLARDPRWGRMHESYGEDPDLVAAMGIAFVRGLQGADLSDGVVSTAKHFLGYGFSQAGLNHGAVSAGRRSLRDDFGRPFEAAIREAGLAAVMNSYSEVDGVPTAADKSLLTGLLRDEFGFEGIVVSDYLAVSMLMSLHLVARDLDEAARLAISAGLDVEFPQPAAYSTLVNQVADGRVDLSIVDLSTRRVLEVKKRLGLLTGSGRRPTAVPPAPDPQAGRKLSYEIARAGVVLLLNRNVLPLAGGARPRRLAVIGQLAASTRAHYGAYSATARSERVVTPGASPYARDAGNDYIGKVLLSNRVNLPNEAAVLERNARLMDDLATNLVDELQARLGTTTELTTALDGGPFGTSQADIDAATAVAREADVAIVVVGEHTGWFASATSGEGRDRQTLELTGDQERLVLEVAGTGVPTVVVLLAGRPQAISRIVEAASAVVFAPLLGPGGPAAVAGALVGDFSPAGRLPVTWPRTTGQIPTFARSHAGSGYSHPTMPVPGYVDGPVNPQFVFGHGLSYTNFEYRRMDVPEDVAVGDPLFVQVTVSNVGQTDCDEVVQVYARLRNVSVTRPLTQLVGFTRTPVRAGGTVRVSFEIPPAMLAFTDGQGELVVEPGTVDLMAGPSSEVLPLMCSVEILGQRTVVRSRGGRFLSTVEIVEVAGDSVFPSVGTGD